ncbi:MAG: M3 family oligoendopeptidase [Spirochaetia bacterium]|jgi:pepF/M3 family oligoendopeptidase|nr:M3 family oligoendopeptidase [Spirochaetia bacterium]
MNNRGTETDLPRWDLSSIYAGFDDISYKNDKQKLSAAFQEALDAVKKGKAVSADDTDWIKTAVEKIDRASALYENIYSFCYALYSVNTKDSSALKELNWLEKEKLSLYKAKTLFRENFTLAKTEIDKRIAHPDHGKTGDSFYSDYRLFLTETAELKKHQLSQEMEGLIEEMLQPGANSWSRLQEAVSSDLSVKWGRGAKERKTVTELRALAFDEERAIRKKAFRKEIEAWKSVEIPLSFALNGVKGFNLILNKRRGWKSAIEKSAFQARISEKTLKALTGAMEKSLPVFHKYLNAKAVLLGLEKLSFYDLFAPLKESTPLPAAPGKAVDEKAGESINSWPFEKGKKFIISTFRDFSGEMGNFAEKAFDEKWIDALPQKGKTGGAYCINFPSACQSRILCNYIGNFSSVSTVAHELGHAWHAEILKYDSHIHQDYPMTLAETASIFSEILVFDTAIKNSSPEGKLYIMEIFLQEITQVIVDILSRFYFEKSVFKKREEGELSSDEFSSLMKTAQKKTYGKSIETRSYHRYMWAVKGHYYIPSLSFYNFPYAFGQLFGIALYRKYLSDRENFPSQYKEILRMSGRASAEETAAKAGFNIENEMFWLDSLDYIREIIDDFLKYAQTGDTVK